MSGQNRTANTNQNNEYVEDTQRFTDLARGL